MPLSNAIDYWLDYKSEVLTLNFTLPFKTPIKEKRFIVEVYDPSYFIAMEFTETDSVKLVGAPAQCGASIQNPQEIAADPTNRFGPADLFAVAENPGSNYASRISVRCQ